MKPVMMFSLKMADEFCAYETNAVKKIGNQKIVTVILKHDGPRTSIISSKKYSLLGY